MLVICSRFLFDERGHCAFHFHHVLFSKNQISAKTSPILKEVCNVFLTWFVILKSEGPRLTWFSFSGWTEPMYIKCHAFGDQYNQDPGNLNWYLVKSSPSWQLFNDRISFTFYRDLLRLSLFSSIFLSMPSFVIILIRETGISAVQDKHDEKKELEVFNFTGAGGVALSMYNTDEVQISQMLFFFLCFFYSWCLTWIWLARRVFLVLLLLFIVYCFCIIFLKTVHSCFYWGFNEYCLPEKVATLS